MCIETTIGRVFRVSMASFCVAALAGCVAPSTPFTDSEPVPVQITTTQSLLLELPLPESPVPIAVYGFEDKTGQFKPQENVQTLSRAVSQGGAAILIKALRDAGNGGWFKVLERTGLDNLLKERKIIREMRSRYLGEKEFNPNALPPLLFAGVILEGGVVGFDSNTLTGGAGARFLGIGADVKYRQNAVTVNLRAVSVKTGEVLANVTIAKTVASIGLQGGVFKYVSFDELLELEAGITNNEQDTLALRRTIEKAVHSLIVEGSEAGLWAFEDEQAGAELVAARRAEQFGQPQSAPAVAFKPISTATAVAVAKAPTPKLPAISTPAASAPDASAPAPALPGPKRSKRPNRKLITEAPAPAENAAPLKRCWPDDLCELPATQAREALQSDRVAAVVAEAKNNADATVTRTVASGYEPVSMANVMTASATKAEHRRQPTIASSTRPAVLSTTEPAKGTN